MDILYTIVGIVEHGANRGKSIGFPTANLSLDQKIPEGIYAAQVTVDGELYIAASFVGSAKTFHKTEVKLESFLLDFDDNLYGKTITVTLYKKLRDNKKFDSVDTLVEQMKLDIKATKTFFKK